MQTARGLVDLAVELAARMQDGHDHFERRFARKFRMVLDRDAAAVIGDGQAAFSIEMHVDEIGMARHRLVHRVVDDFCKQMVQRPFRRCRQYTCPTPAHRLQPLEHFDGGCVIIARIGLQRCRSATALLCNGSRCRFGGNRLRHDGIRRGLGHQGQC